MTFMKFPFFLAFSKNYQRSAPYSTTQATQTHPECQLCLAGDLYVRHDAVLVLVQAVEQGGVAAVLVEVRPANLRIIGWSLILSKKIDFLAK